MKNRNVKVVDQNNIDRDANVVFAIDLEGSEYVVYWVERDDDENNLFVSKLIKNTDGTSNLLDIESLDEKNKVSDVVKTLIAKSVKDESDKLANDSVTLDNGTVVKFVDVSFNKEQRFNVQKTYITTVKKEVTKVSEKYYDVVVAAPASNVVEDIFPTVAPVVPEVTPIEPVAVSIPEIAPVVETKVEAAPVLTAVQPTVVEPITTPTPVVPEPVVAPVVPEPVAVQPASVEPAVVAEVKSEVVEPVIPTLVTPVPEVTPAPEAVVTPAEPASQPLVFNASKETNLNAALGEVAKDSTIPVENIEPVREFGVDAPVVPEPAVVQPAPAAPVTQPVENPTAPVTPVAPVNPKSGFANSKFFMVVAVAFFLASCIFLGYEVFNYFQLTK